MGTQIRDPRTLYVIAYLSIVYNLYKSLNASPFAFNMKKQASTSAKGMLSHCDTWSFATRYMVFGASIHGLSQLNRCLFAIEKFLAAVFTAQTRRPRAPVRPKSQHNFLTKNHNNRRPDGAKRSGHRGTWTSERSHKKSAYLLTMIMASADTRSSKLYRIFQI